MEYVLLLLVCGTLAMSFFCSMAEAALYSIPASYVKLLQDSGSRSAAILARFKEDMAQPIAAILILNTLANTLGPTVAGSIADDLWGDRGVFLVAGGLTLVILFAGEIIPKVLGVAYAKTLAPLVAVPLHLGCQLLYPLIWVSNRLSSVITPETSGPSVSHEEVISMAEIGTEEGALDEFEGEVIANVIELDEIILRDILTPRVVVFRLRDDLTIGEVERELPEWSHSRVPIYPQDDPEHLTGYVLQRDVFREALKGNRDTPLKQISRQIPVVPELMRADRLLLRMVDKREHICAVIDEHGGLAGIVTLEDVLEQLIGKEIVDEYDAVADLRTFAGLLKVVRHRRRQEAAESDAAAAKESARQHQLERVLREARRLKAAHEAANIEYLQPKSKPKE